jgi:putative cell wall-binding protein
MANFNAGLIISDNNFYDGSALDEAGVQAFLNSKVPDCRAGYTCLKAYAESTSTMSADAMCGAYGGAAAESAARIITKVGRACGISQKVLLVLLQKEQGLVTDTWPSAGQYRKATGFACPDTSACDTRYYGFFNQVYHAAWQFKRYGNPPGTSNYFNWFPVGQTTAVRYSPDASCGSGPVYIRSRATAALYYYTPYQPNAAALANPGGLGDSCSSYGNRNFYAFYTDWFGDPASTQPPFGNFDAAQISDGVLRMHGWAIDPASPSTSVSVQFDITDPSGKKTSASVVANVSRPDVGAAYASIGAGNYHGFSAVYQVGGSGPFTICTTIIASMSNSGGNGTVGCKSIFYSTAINGVPSIVRVSGADRYATAAAFSKSAYPNGAVPVVFIATGESFADAIAAAPAAAAQGGPLLLVYGNAIPGATMDELKRLAAKKIVVVGGESAVSTSVYSQLAMLAPSIQRVAGTDRFDTSRKLAAIAFPAQTAVMFATGWNFPDALSASSVAGATGKPVVLVNGVAGGVDTGTSQYIADRAIKQVQIVGGAAAVSNGLMSGLQAQGVSVTRSSGDDRYLTNNALVSAAFSAADTVYLATGEQYPDALAAAAVAGAKKKPMLMAPGYCLSRYTGKSIATLGTKSVILVGGASALTDNVAALNPCP